MSSLMPEDPATIDLSQAGGSPPDDSGSDPVSMLKDAIDSLTKFQKVEPDAADKAVAAKVLAQLHGLLAKEQTDKDSALSGSLNPRLLRKNGVVPPV